MIDQLPGMPAVHHSADPKAPIDWFDFCPDCGAGIWTEDVDRWIEGFPGHAPDCPQRGDEWLLGRRSLMGWRWWGWNNWVAPSLCCRACRHQIPVPRHDENGYAIRLLDQGYQEWIVEAMAHGASFSDQGCHFCGQPFGGLT